MANYDSNYAIAQEISARIGTSPIPFDSVYSIALEIYNELGGEPTEFDSVYSILLGILPLVEGGIASKVIDDNSIVLDKTWSSSKINEEIQAVGGTADSEFDGKTTEDFRFVTELPLEATEGEQVVIKGENVDTLYKYVSGAWVEQTPDANILYFDTENEALYSYVSSEQQFATISSVSTIVVGKNLNTNEALKAIKTPGTYSVLQRTSSSTKGEYTKKWTLTVEGIDYEEYELTDSIYQRMQSNYTIYKRTWSSARATNDGWSNFSTYYAGEIKDSTTSKYYTWSSNKLTTELAAKQDTLTAGSGIVISGDTISCNVEPGQSLVAGQNISIDSGNTISAEGYVFDNAKGAFGEQYLDDDNNIIATNTATGIGSHAEGWDTTASGDYGSHAEGYQTTANETCAHSEGFKTKASGNGSHVEGIGTTAQNSSEHAEGSNNLSHKASDTFGNAGNTLHSIGNSDLMNVKYNALEIMQNADMYVKGIGGYQGTNTKVQDSTIKPLQTVISDINSSVASKQDTLTAGTNITISGTTISATYEVATTADIEALFS